MGASLSDLNESGNGGPGLGDIPESCVACVFLYLSPPEICNLARLNRAFRGAASSDAVWETKLPSNYQLLLHLLSHPDVHQNLSKKDIFALLARPLPFDDGNKARFIISSLFLPYFSIYTTVEFFFVTSVTGILEFSLWFNQLIFIFPLELDWLESLLYLILHIDLDYFLFLFEGLFYKIGIWDFLCVDDVFLSILAEMHSAWWLKISSATKFSYLDLPFSTVLPFASTIDQWPIIYFNFWMQLDTL